MDDAKREGRRPRSPSLPCPIHGDLPDLLPQNVWVWEFFCQTVLSVAIRTETHLEGKMMKQYTRLDMPALHVLAQTYPVGNQRVFFEQIKILFKEWIRQP